jgi:phosphate starvation-inducible PhoH-like protein
MPGTLDEKLRVYEQPYREIVNNLLCRGDAYDILKSKNVIEFMSTSFIRGLTIDNAVVIVDEIQNLSFAELDSVITRVGEGTKIVFCGDFRQTDLKNAKEKSGIHDFMSILDKMKKFDHIEFLETDIVRSGLVRDYIVTKTEMGLA